MAAEHILPAAAIHKGDVVMVNVEGPDGIHQEAVRIGHIDNGTPRAGRITWYDEDGLLIDEVGGTQKIKVVELA